MVGDVQSRFPSLTVLDSDSSITVHRLIFILLLLLTNEYSENTQYSAWLDCVEESFLTIHIAVSCDQILKYSYIRYPVRCFLVFLQSLRCIVVFLRPSKVLRSPKGKGNKTPAQSNFIILKYTVFKQAVHSSLRAPKQPLH